jgi:hypothetical protein
MSKADEILEGYADADFANDINDRKSFSGIVFKSFGNIVLWCSRKQKVVSLSSTEGEIISLCSAACKMTHLKKVLEDFGESTNPRRSFFLSLRTK